MSVVGLEVTRPMNGQTTARAEGLVGCRRCSRVWPIEKPTCDRCGARLQSRDRYALQKVWAWWLMGIAAYIPANVFPMLETRTLFLRSDDTIIGGAITLAQHGSIGIALVILVASVGIPLAKFFAIAYLALSVTKGSVISPHRRQGVYEVVEYIGRWSMIDVFVVAILASLVQLNVVASVKPGIASLAFALSVIFTMLSAQSFDSRMIWDTRDKAGSGGESA